MTLIEPHIAPLLKRTPAEWQELCAEAYATYLVLQSRCERQEHSEAELSILRVKAFDRYKRRVRKYRKVLTTCQ